MLKSDIALELRGVTKRFGKFVANDSIDLQLKKGEIKAILGENGAGKSTLMNIVFGLYQPEEGEIFVNGNSVVVDNPNKAIDLGIGMVHQHFKLVEPFTVTENIILGMEPKKGVKIDIKGAEKAVLELSKKYGLDIDPSEKIESITVGMQQRVEILKILYRGAEILIFDEPTAVLTPNEITELLKILKALAKEGKSIILITHKLHEIMQVADSCTIIRKGKVVKTVDIKDTTPDELATLMVGKQIQRKIERKEIDLKENLLEVKDLVVVNSKGKKVVNEATFSIKAGEIVGIAGVDGNGQAELVEAITRMQNYESGSVIINHKDTQRLFTRDIYELGVGHIPEDRHKHGLVLDFSISKNMILQDYYKPSICTNGFINEEKVKEKSQRLVKDFDVRAQSDDAIVRSMSGGNQQKVIIGREIDKDPKVMIAVQPTRGLDVGAIDFVHRQLVKLRDNGVAILLVSFELDEILSLSDRILVMFEGKIIGETTPQKTNDKELGLMMAGKYEEGDKNE